MKTRQFKEDDRFPIYFYGYLEWGRGSYDDYGIENDRENETGTRYVLENNYGVVVSSLLTEHRQIKDLDIVLVGSLLTAPFYRRRGYARKLVVDVVDLLKSGNPNTIFLLYSDIDPRYYRRLGFIDLPWSLQKSKSHALAYGNQDGLSKLFSLHPALIPDYF